MFRPKCSCTEQVLTAVYTLTYKFIVRVWRQVRVRAMACRRSAATGC